MLAWSALAPLTFEQTITARAALAKARSNNPSFSLKLVRPNPFFGGRLPHVAKGRHTVLKLKCQPLKAASTSLLLRY